MEALTLDQANEAKKVEGARLAGGFAIANTNEQDLWDSERGDYFAEECSDIPFGD